MMKRSTSNSSVGLLGWVRRRVLPRVSMLCALLGVLVLGAWITGRVLTDEYQWSQYIWWVPPIWMVGSGWVLLVISAALGKLARRPGGVMIRPFLLLMNIGCTGFLVFGVWHLHRAVLPTPRADNPIRIAHWNQASADINQQAWAQSLLDEQTDIILVANASWGAEQQGLLDALAPIARGYAPEKKRRWVNYSYRVHADPSYFWIQNGALIASRYPIVRTGKVNFGSADRQQLMSHSSSMIGWVMFAEIDLAGETAGSGDTQGESDAVHMPEPFVIWFVDLPSNPFISRQLSMGLVRSAIDRWDGSGWAMGKHVWEQHTWDGDKFPKPDLIMGDFNTLGGSDSLNLLMPAMTDANEAVGYGRARSWMPTVHSRFLRQPFKLADWHIDLALVGHRWRSVAYRIQHNAQWGWSPHQMQMVDLDRTKSEP